MEVQAMEEAGELQEGMGIRYNAASATGEQLTAAAIQMNAGQPNIWVEFHIDDHPSFQTK